MNPLRAFSIVLARGPATNLTKMIYVIRLATVLTLLHISGLLMAQDVKQSSGIIPLEQFVGYYDVGVKPNKPFFKSRWYLRDGKLFTIYDSDIDRELIPFEDGVLSPTIFLSDEDVKVADTDSTYYLVLNFEKGQLASFRVIRPRKIWPTDLYGYRNTQLSELAVDTEASLTLTKRSAHFAFHYSEKDSSVIEEIAVKLESNYADMISKFGRDNFPLTTIRIYPDLPTYHNAVLTPGAPAWQMGRAWDTNEIRMLSTIEAEALTGELMNPGEMVLHEFVHCVHLSSIPDSQNPPGWLWEGLAIYLGCCQWISNPFELDYMQKGKYPSIKQIENDRTFQKKYELGYHFAEFLHKEYGWSKILALVRSNGDIKTSLGLSTKQFEQAFYNYLEAEYK